MNLDRRLALALLAVGVSAAPAFAQDWKAKYLELVYATVPAEKPAG